MVLASEGFLDQHQHQLLSLANYVKVNEDDHYYNNYIVTYPYRIQEQLGN